MDSATLEEVDVDLASRLDDAVPPPACEWQEDGRPAPCGTLATWICIMACCHSFYYCDEHKAAREAFVNQPGANFCRGNLDRGRIHRGPKSADPVRFERIER